MEVETAVLPWQFKILDQRPGVRFQLGCGLLVADIKKTTVEALPPHGHQFEVATVVAGHFALLVGMQVGIGKELLEAGEAGIHRVALQMHNLGVGQSLENQWNE